ncbi:hypothetical protein EIN_222570 [Entamoeba invadens IP1]|uniref:DDE-1 domain-containing protein n=1 Tax=Entamoeba invadens IP1 TaxID=370355 RepID=A0A0A1U253_ENTIV|nr:hypothetical protein EIN_222570 [Entamoeba invadens IP1]ELP88104.1 hypothetical protein EIN_222570 [Entamoeba invadens IP1]|eukprot:XP_004254875.1 hypothetical protein EIN_222570 [Entamoeba invadens IP1]
MEEHKEVSGLDILMPQRVSEIKSEKEKVEKKPKRYSFRGQDLEAMKKLNDSGLKQKELLKEIKEQTGFKLSSSTLATLRANNFKKHKRGRKAKFPDLYNILNMNVENCLTNDIPIHYFQIMVFAKELISHFHAQKKYLEVTEESINQAWVQTFCKSQTFSETVTNGEFSGIDLASYSTTLDDIRSAIGYMSTLGYVSYSMDEIDVSLRYIEHWSNSALMKPTLVGDDRKKLTAILCGSSSGGKCILGVFGSNKSSKTDGIVYFHGTATFLDYSSLWKWVSCLDFGAENGPNEEKKKILMLIDNNEPHLKLLEKATPIPLPPNLKCNVLQLHGYENVAFLVLPKGTTGLFQPMCQGIKTTFKTIFKTKMIDDYLQKNVKISLTEGTPEGQLNEEIPVPSILSTSIAQDKEKTEEKKRNRVCGRLDDYIQMMKETWDEITEDSIRAGWTKSTLLPEAMGTLPRISEPSPQEEMSKHTLKEKVDKLKEVGKLPKEFDNEDVFLDTTDDLPGLITSENEKKKKKAEEEDQKEKEKQINNITKTLIDELDAIVDKEAQKRLLDIVKAKLEAFM